LCWHWYFGRCSGVGGGDAAADDDYDCGYGGDDVMKTRKLDTDCNSLVAVCGSVCK
jgi:hypothetical protein